MEQKIQDGDIGYTVGERQHVDISQVRQFVTDAIEKIGDKPNSYPACLRSVVEVGPMILELCDLTENSGFLNEVEQARADMETEDNPTRSSACDMPPAVLKRLNRLEQVEPV